LTVAKKDLSTVKHIFGLMLLLQKMVCYCTDKVHEEERLKAQLILTIERLARPPEMIRFSMQYSSVLRTFSKRRRGLM